MDEVDLSTAWIDEFEYNDTDYEQFYKTKLEYIKLIMLYVDRSNTIIHIKKQNLNIVDNVLDRKKLLPLIKRNMNYNYNEYRPISILQYNINLDPENVKNFLQNPETYNFLTPKNSIDSLHWDDTIKLFEDMNSLYIIFYEKWYTSNKGTRKVYIRSSKKAKRQTKKTKKLSRRNRLKINAKYTHDGILY